MAKSTSGNRRGTPAKNKGAAKRKAPGKKSAAKKAVAKKKVSKKATVKKTTPKKALKKTVSKKVVSKKTTSKKIAAKKFARKTAVKKSAVKKTASKRPAPVKKVGVKTTAPAKKAIAATSAPVKNVASKQTAPARNIAAPAKKTGFANTPVKSVRPASAAASTGETNSSNLDSYKSIRPEARSNEKPSRYNRESAESDYVDNTNVPDRYTGNDPDDADTSINSDVAVETDDQAGLDDRDVSRTNVAAREMNEELITDGPPVVEDETDEDEEEDDEEDNDDDDEPGDDDDDTTGGGSGAGDDNKINAGKENTGHTQFDKFIPKGNTEQKGRFNSKPKGGPKPSGKKPLWN